MNKFAIGHMTPRVGTWAKAAVGAVVALGAAAANAALDTAVSTEIATAKTDIVTLGGLVFGVFVAIALYKWFKRAL